MGACITDAAYRGPARDARKLSASDEELLYLGTSGFHPNPTGAGWDSCIDWPASEPADRAQNGPDHLLEPAFSRQR